MTNARKRPALMILAALCALGATAAAQETARVAVAPESRLWIDGTSNLHAWTCRAETLDAAIDLDAATAAQLGTAPPKALKRVQVKVPVRALKCGHGAMDDNLYKALGATDASANISYIMATFDAIPGEVKDRFTLHTIGTLTVAGRDNRVTVDVEATRMPDGTVRAKGVVPIRMSDYGITPPTAIFGRLKTGNDVKVSFELVVGARAIAAAVAQP